MVEMKSRGGPASRRSYPPNQFMNYMRLVAECRNTGDPSLPTRFVHVILVPSTELKWLERHSEWVVAANGLKEGRLRVDPRRCLTFGKTFWRHRAHELRRLLQEVPIYYRAWADLPKASERALVAYGDHRNQKHWARVGHELAALAETAGRYRDRA